MRVLRATSAVVAGGLALGYLWTHDPHVAGTFPKCPFLLATGHWCPGCGSLRALYDLMHGNLPEALAHNVLTVLAVPALAGLGLARVVGAGRRWQWYARVSRALSTSVAPAMVAFWVLRNMPGPLAVLAP